MFIFYHVNGSAIMHKKNGGFMDQTKFQSDVQRAKYFISCESGERQQFWRGYYLGLNRGFHGESFNSDEWHEAMMQLESNEIPEEREKGRGYRLGIKAAESGIPYELNS